MPTSTCEICSKEFWFRRGPAPKACSVEHRRERNTRRSAARYAKDPLPQRAASSRWVNKYPERRRLANKNNKAKIKKASAALQALEELGLQC